tara:strand:+ start:1330 stop:1872 length:543 start_codon:yes stop_codon:yes gene_type:complete
MESLTEVNELLTTKMCSPVIVYGVVSVISFISIYLCRSNLSRYRTLKMDNLHKLFTMQEIKFLIVLGVVMFGLCQYNKTELAWIFLIFPIIYSMIQNTLIFIHVSSALQNAPQEQVMQIQNYGVQHPPLLANQGPPKPEITPPKHPSGPPVVTSGDFNFAVPSNGGGMSLNNHNSFGSMI